MMSRKDFIDWYLKWVGGSGFMMSPGTLYDECVKVHEPLYKMLGGSERQEKIDLGTYKEPLPIEKATEYMTRLAWLAPGYIYDYKLTPYSFQTSQTKTPDGKRDVKFGKHFNHWLSSTGEKDKVDAKAAEKVMQDIGQDWARCRTKSRDIYVTLTADPKAFIMLGHYTADAVRGSCFKQGAGNDKHKYLLATTPGSYVILVGSEPDSASGNKSTLMSRLWGLADPNLNVFNVLNAYYNNGVEEAYIHQSIPKFFSRLLGDDDLVKEIDKIGLSGVYQNRGVNWSFHRKTHGFCNQNYTIAPTLFNTLRACDKCKFLTSSQELRYVDANHAVRVCENCYDKLPECYLTKKKVLEIRNVIFEDGIVHPVQSNHPDLRTCYVTHKIYHVRAGRLNRAGQFYSFDAIKPPYLESHPRCRKCEEPLLDLNYKSCEACRVEARLKKASETVGESFKPTPPKPRNVAYYYDTTRHSIYNSHEDF